MVDKLKEYNKHWAAIEKLKNHSYFIDMAKSQSPEYLFIGCSDSRVASELILGLNPGELFVHRNVSNVINENDIDAMAVLQYAIEELKVRHIIVCGHTGCGGVKASLENNVSGYLKEWLKDIRDIAEEHKDELDREADFCHKHNKLVELNVQHQVKNIATNAMMQKAWKNGQNTVVHGWIYQMESGLIKDLNISVNGK